jgi:hypothetical protein
LHNSVDEALLLKVNKEYANGLNMDLIKCATIISLLFGHVSDIFPL